MHYGKFNKEQLQRERQRIDSLLERLQTFDAKKAKIMAFIAEQNLTDEERKEVFSDVEGKGIGIRAPYNFTKGYEWVDVKTGQPDSWSGSGGMKNMKRGLKAYLAAHPEVKVEDLLVKK